MKKKRNWLIFAFLLMILIHSMVFSCDPLSMSDIMNKGNPGIFDKSRFDKTQFGP